MILCEEKLNIYPITCFNSLFFFPGCFESFLCVCGLEVRGRGGQILCKIIEPLSSVLSFVTSIESFTVGIVPNFALVFKL